ncbi:MAG TPA: hypothetical protein VI873_04730 [Candidatus Peribacteraceae bacterium]|nr:hypothetical protein [Candidatus Peribacteraceae bacterium]
MSWNAQDLGKLVHQRRATMSFFPDERREEELTKEFEQVLAGRTLLSIELCAELGIYFDCPPIDFFASTLNGEAAKLQSTLKALEEASGKGGDKPDKPKSLRALRGEALTAMMAAAGKKPRDIAAVKVPRRGKARNEYRNRVYAWSKGTALLPEEEISFLAGVLSVHPQRLIVREPNARELEFMRRSSVGKETRGKKGRRKQKVVEGGEATKSRSASTQVSLDLDFNAYQLSAAVKDADYTTVSVEGPELVIRIPLTPDLIMKGMKNG